jgi:hypothetical protein
MPHSISDVKLCQGKFKTGFCGPLTVCSQAAGLLSACLIIETAINRTQRTKSK